MQACSRQVAVAKQARSKGTRSAVQAWKPTKHYSLWDRSSGLTLLIRR